MTWIIEFLDKYLVVIEIKRFSTTLPYPMFAMVQKHTKYIYYSSAVNFFF